MTGKVGSRGLVDAEKFTSALISCRCGPGTKHKTILEARSGLGPIKAYPRLGPPTPGEPEAPSQDRTFHCEICNVKVNSEVQLKQVSPTPIPGCLKNLTH